MQSSEVFSGVGIEWLDDEEWIVTPSQSRSRKTLVKLLLSGKKLFIERGYQETSMKDICEAASVSIGSLYHHFPDKKSLFYTLLEMYRRSRFALIDGIVEDPVWQQRSAEEVLAFHIEIMFSSARQDEGFQRLMERQRIVDRTVCQLLLNWNEHVVGVIYQLMKPHASQIPHDDLHDAIRYVHGILRGSLMWAVLPVHNENPVLDPASDEYRQRCFDMAKAYLGL